MMSSKNRSWRLVVIVLLLAALLLSGCGSKDKKSDKPKSYTIGVLTQTQSLVPALDGFKARMTELGYVEGQNVVYLFDGPMGTTDTLKSSAENLKSQKTDLIFTIGTPSTQAARDVFADTNIPIVFAPAANLVELGFVKSFQSPGGNLTGINATDTVAKALEWLLQIVPNTRRVYVPSNAQDAPSVQSVQILIDAGKAVGVEFVVSEGSTAEEWDAITTNIPEGVDAVFLARSGAIGARVGNIVQAANARGIPVVSSDIGYKIAQGVMMGYGPGYYEMGYQAARLADQILKGTSPAVLPVESAETYLGINLQTAQTIGITIPDTILNQAKQIVRPPA